MEAWSQGLLGASEAPTSLAHQMLLQAAQDALKTCPQGYMDGTTLAAQLRQLHPEHVAEVTGASVNASAKSRKGWIRQLLSLEPAISQVQVAGRSDICFTLATGAELANLSAVVVASTTAPGGFGGAAAGAMRLASAAGLGMPDAKRQREDLPTMAARIPEPIKQELLAASADALRAIAHQQDHLEGSKLSQTLKMSYSDSVDAAKAAAGGKGWLKALLETASESFQLVEVPGKAEPCYRLIDGSVAYPEASLELAPRVVPPMWPRPQGPVGLGAQPQAPSQALVPNTLPQWIRQELLQASIQAISSSEKGFLEGNRLSDALRTVRPELVSQAKTILGGKDGKGWLKNFMATEATILKVEVDAVKEPCYSLAGLSIQAPAPKVPAPQGAAPPSFPHFGMGGMAVRPPMAARPPFPGMLANRGMMPRPPRQPWAGGQAAFPAFPRPIAPAAPVVSEADVQDVIPLLIQATITKLSEVPEYMEGNKLSEALKAAHPAAVERTRTALGGKGWMKKLLDREPRVCKVTVHNLHEPCYALAEKCAWGAMEFTFTRPEVPNQDPMRTPLTGESLLEKISAEDAQQLSFVAAGALEAAGATQTQGGFLEGSKLAERMKAMQPALIERVRVQANVRKGWLKAVLELEPRIVRTEVEGRSEPCYCLTGL